MNATLSSFKLLWFSFTKFGTIVLTFILTVCIAKSDTSMHINKFLLST